ncbi:MAG: hypothetical protein ACTSU4_04280 [Promethearchaeota archaeon]
MPKCDHCGNEVEETYFCSQCGFHYCFLHVKPEDHECSIIKSQGLTIQETFSPVEPQQWNQEMDTIQHHPPMDDTSQRVKRGTTDGSYTWYREEVYIPENAFDPASGIKFKGILLSHKSEGLHFLIGAILIFSIGILGFYNQTLIDFGLGWMIFLLAGFYTTAFLFHELGHRQVARHYGFQTKFRLLTYGIFITLVSLFLGLFSLLYELPTIPTLALPGAVVVLGLDKIDKKTGYCKAAGPSINLVYGIILLVISFILPKTLYPLNMFIGYAAALNFSLGSFNMIPVGILDGYNIFKWNKTIYFLLVSSLLILLIITLANIYAPIEISNYFPRR